MRDPMSQLYLCEEPYWSKYDGSDIASEAIQINVISDGITRLPVLEGEVSHVEIPRTSSSLGITIVGGADTPLRCVVVQEVYPDGLIAMDGRLQPGDQIIEINGADMTCAPHSQVCSALRKMTLVLRLGVYRERIEKYGGRILTPFSEPDTPTPPTSSTTNGKDLSTSSTFSQRNKIAEEEILTISLEREPGRQLGIRLCGSNPADPGIFIADIQDGSSTANDGRLRIRDRLLFVNGQDVRNSDLGQASVLIQNSDTVSLVIGRLTSNRNGGDNFSNSIGQVSNNHAVNGEMINHGMRFRPATFDNSSKAKEDGKCFDHVYDVPDCELVDDHVAVYETLDRTREVKRRNMNGKSHTERSEPSLQETTNKQTQNECHTNGNGNVVSEKTSQQTLKQSGIENTRPDVVNRDLADGTVTIFMKRALRVEGPQLLQRTILVKKSIRESLGMRIGGGIGSNEGDTPIYVANIHPTGCVGKSKQLKKGDLLLSVDGTSLCGLTHAQAVATLKATVTLDQVVLGVMDGPESSYGSANFVPTWMYWQKLPRSLQFPKTVILQRRQNASWGFSIVGGADTGGSRPPEPIHVLFVVPESPASKDAKLRCGDRLLAVDGHSLENIPHQLAVAMLKQTSTRVVMEVVSWMGTEI